MTCLINEEGIKSFYEEEVQQDFKRKMEGLFIF